MEVHHGQQAHDGGTERHSAPQGRLHDRLGRERQQPRIDHLRQRDEERGGHHRRIRIGQALHMDLHQERQPHTGADRIGLPLAPLCHIRRRGGCTFGHHIDPSDLPHRGQHNQHSATRDLGEPHLQHAFRQRQLGHIQHHTLEHRPTHDLVRGNRPFQRGIAQGSGNRFDRPLHMEIGHQRAAQLHQPPAQTQRPGRLREPAHMGQQLRERQSRL